MKIIFQFLLILVVTLTFPEMHAQNQPKAKVVIVNMLDSMASHVYGDRFNASIQEKDIFDYGKYSVDEITRMLEKSGFEVIGAEAPLYYRTAALQNFIGQPGQKTKMWLSYLNSEYDADYLVIIKHKFIPEENQNERFLEKQQYGLATYLYAPDVLSVFSFAGYYIFSVKEMKAVKINSNHDQYVIVDIPLEMAMSAQELKSVPEKYLNMAVDHLKYIADTRNAEIERAILQR
ncbi:MAG: hypothetical protein K9H16_14220 [Bacteroidales bacterium]|nr:hypothetical protein [Bacteroidales bacterium]